MSKIEIITAALNSAIADYEDAASKNFPVAYCLCTSGELKAVGTEAQLWNRVQNWKNKYDAEMSRLSKNEAHMGQPIPVGGWDD